MFLNNFNTKGLLDNITAVGVMKRHLNERLFLLFENDDEIIYIPDISLNDIPMDRPLRNGEEIEEVLSVCYAGVDFVQECAGDVKLAEQLFYYCDWQHPSSALPEVDYEDEVI